MENTGERLKRMNISFSKIIVSTSTRADESADILFNYISTVNSKVTKTATLREGRPTFPNPGIDTWDPNDKVNANMANHLALRSIIKCN